MASRTMRFGFVRPVLLLAAVASIVVATDMLADRPAVPPLQAEARPTSGAPLDWSSELARLNLKVADNAERVRTRPGEWLMEEGLASAFIARARLTGSYQDYAAAEAALARAFANAPKGAGPHLTQAALDLSLHRLNHAQTMLDAVARYAIPDPGDQREAAGMRGDVNLYSGRYAAAQRDYRASGSPYRAAVIAMRTGRPEQALAAVDAAARPRGQTAQLLSSLELLRGTIELQRGERDAASRAFDRADRLFPGSWLIGAHQAQMLALAGNVDAAIKRYLAIAAATPEPLVMDALASLYRARGDQAQSQTWARRAAEGWDARLKLFPEAAWGHAVEHELAFGDPARALTLARLDFANRPHGATATALGWALIANGRPADALRAIEPSLRSSWTAAEQHLVASQALLLLGRGEEATHQRDKALAINPRAADLDASLLWFGH